MGCVLPLSGAEGLLGRDFAGSGMVAMLSAALKLLVLVLLQQHYP